VLEESFLQDENKTAINQKRKKPLVNSFLKQLVM
jgi:hypothetical protein